jgi:hypothetical protein
VGRQKRSNITQLLRTRQKKLKDAPFSQNVFPLPNAVSVPYSLAQPQNIPSKNHFRIVIFVPHSGKQQSCKLKYNPFFIPQAQSFFYTPSIFLSASVYPTTIFNGLLHIFLENYHACTSIHALCTDTHTHTHTHTHTLLFQGCCKLAHSSVMLPPAKVG